MGAVFQKGLMLLMEMKILAVVRVYCHHVTYMDSSSVYFGYAVGFRL